MSTRHTTTQHGDVKMTKFRDFGSPVTAENSEPVSFKLYGEDFQCRAQIPGKVMLDLATRSADENDAAGNAQVITDFFDFVLVPESAARFSALCMDPERVVTIEQLMAIVSWLMETYAERPTTRSEDSPAGQ